ncbi:unnamed protein product [Pseudo-nitzschia multistriata]|uniref:Uncharacterized protein n=1 Tax=Pseudo-nitzschia multistriata TaxID=183589 RepID=A0A448ZKN6_9STRA|nr:unnamed protein product [Pseudo-nitzschia multistriata]
MQLSTLCDASMTKMLSMLTEASIRSETQSLLILNLHSRIWHKSKNVCLGSERSKGQERQIRRSKPR